MFDPISFKDRADYSNSFQYSDGLIYSIINGQLVIDKKTYTKKLNGRVLENNNSKHEKIELHWKIIIGMVLGLIFGFIMTQIKGGVDFSNDWIKPIGTIFIKLLKLIAIPLILASLIKGISDLKDISKFKLIGIRTMVIYVITTIIAITLGLLLVNIFEPGNGISDETISKLTNTYAQNSGVQDKLAAASIPERNWSFTFYRRYGSG